MVCRFYGYTIEQIENMTLSQFELLSVNMEKICEMENPKEKEEAQSLSSTAFKSIVGKNKNKIPQRKK